MAAEIKEALRALEKRHVMLEEAALAFIRGPPEPFIPEELQLKPAVGVIFLYIGPVEDSQRAVARSASCRPAIALHGPVGGGGGFLGGF